MPDRQDGPLDQPDYMILNTLTAAKILGIKSKTLRNRIHRKSIRASLIGGYYYVSVGEVKRYLNAHAPKEK